MKYKTIVVDPPWHIKMGSKRKQEPDGKGRWWSTTAIKDLPYPTMSIEQIKALPINDLTEKDAHLYLWTVNKYLEDAYAIVGAGDFVQCNC